MVKTMAVNNTTKVPIKQLDLNSLGSIRKKTEAKGVVQPAAKKTTSFTETVFTSLKNNPQYKKFIDRYFDNMNLKQKEVRMDCESSLGTTRKIIATASMFEKRKSNDIFDIDYLEKIIKEIEEFNNIQKPSEQAVAENVKKHAEARILLFYQLCHAYEKSRRTTRIDWKGASMQIHKGKEIDHTEACHHALFAATTDSFFQDLIKDVAADVQAGKNSDKTVLMLLSLGIARDEIDAFMKEAKEKPEQIESSTEKLLEKHKEESSVLSKNSLLYYMHNHTIIASSHLNRVDDLIEQATRGVALAIVNEVAKGKMSAYQAVDELAKHIESTLAESGKTLKQLVSSATKVDTLRAQIQKSAQFQEARHEKNILDISSSLEALGKELNAHRRIAKDLGKELDVYGKIAREQRYAHLATYTALIEKIDDIRSSLLTKDAREKITQYMEIDKRIQEAKQEKDTVKELIQTQNSLNIGPVVEGARTKIKNELLPQIEALSESHTGKVLTLSAVKEQEKFLQLQFQATQALARKLKEPQFKKPQFKEPPTATPEDTAVKQLAAIAHTIKPL